jgi:hypothetical protein
VKKKRQGIGVVCYCAEIERPEAKSGDKALRQRISNKNPAGGIALFLCGGCVLSARDSTFYDAIYSLFLLRIDARETWTHASSLSHLLYTFVGQLSWTDDDDEEIGDPDAFLIPRMCETK